ncbi:MAG: hypothetical protein HY247_05725 [archaeon]|nr:MAG: hypothetical protein HY247_05725 [archaeon]
MNRPDMKVVTAPKAAKEKRATAESLVIPGPRRAIQATHRGKAYVSRTPKVVRLPTEGDT